MSLHPDLEAFLELSNAPTKGGRRPMSQMSPEEARAAYDAATLALDVPGPRVTTEPLSIPSRDGAALPARLYRGVAPGAGPCPVLLYFHGGGYVLGGLESHDSLCRQLAAQAGCAVLAVAYRRAPEHKFPTAFEDAEDAHVWLLEQARAHGLDSLRMAVGGDSVGGTLAIGLGIAAREARRPQPLLQLLLYPCTSAQQDTASHHRYAAGYLLEQETLQWMFRHYLRSDADRSDWRFAPLLAQNLENLPPTHVVLAEYDPLFDEGTAYAERLRAARVRVHVEVYAGMVHDFARLGNVTAESEKMRADVARALRAAFQAPSA
ncbi:MAG: alpha/beta hydrolase [Polyangiaceae bacterium]